MARLSTARFVALRYEPGNPLFPTLPDGVQVPHVGAWGTGASQGFKQPPGANPGVVSRRFAVTPNLDNQRFAGWQDLTTWINPALVDFGIIPVPVQRTVTLYNARPFSIDVTAITLPAGVTLISPALPVTITQYAGASFVVEASNNGDPSFDDLITFTTSEGDISARAIGQRIFTIEAQPQRPIQELIRFKTSLLRSRDASEAAYGLLQSPNSVVQYKIRWDREQDRARFRNEFMASQANLVIGAQKWYEARNITSAAASVDTVIQVDTTEASFTIDQPVSFVTPAGVFVLGTIASFDPTSITLANAIGTDLPAGTQCMPVGLGYLSTLPKFGTFPVNAEDVDYAVTFNRQSDQAALSIDFPLFNSLPVLEECNIITGASQPGSVNRPEDVLDSGLSNRLAFNQFPRADEVQQFNRVLDTRYDIWRWRQFLYYQRGSYREFYVPTFRVDLPNVFMPIDTVTFDADFTALNAIAPESPREGLRFEYPDGTILYRPIANVVDNGTFETVTITGGTVLAGSPKVSLLLRARILGDSAQFRWSRPDYAELSFQYRTVQT